MTKEKQPQQLSKYMTIGLTDNNECAVKITESMDATTAFQLLGTLALHILKSYEAVAHQALAAQFNNSSTDSDSKSNNELELAKQGMTESLFDAMDNVFSNVLDNFYPTNPKASIEDEAILELTNKIIEERYNALTPEEREAFSKGYRTVQASITEHLSADTSTTDSDTTSTTDSTEEPSDVDVNA